MLMESMHLQGGNLHFFGSPRRVGAQWLPVMKLMLNCSTKAVIKRAAWLNTLPASPQALKPGASLSFSPILFHHSLSKTGGRVGGQT